MAPLSLKMGITMKNIPADLWRNEYFESLLDGKLESPPQP